MHKRHLYFLRHAESVYNREGIFQGQLDSPLTKEGEHEAESIIPKLKDFGFKHIACSPLSRARQTANIINKELRLWITQFENLQEANFGSLQTEKRAPVWEEFKRNFYENGNPIGGGESKNDFFKRIEHCVREILQEIHEDPILVVSHGMLMKILIGEWFTRSNYEDLNAILMPNLALYKIEVKFDKDKVIPEKYEFIDLEAKATQTF